MARGSFEQSWRELARSEGLDSRIHFWRLEADARRLLARPGPALEAAREFVGGLAGDSPQLIPLEERETLRVKVSHTALRRDPAHAAEQVSQLRLGQPFHVWHRDDEGEWCLGAGPDGYPGWIRAWHLAQGEPESPDHVVHLRRGRALRDPDRESEILHELSFGTLLRACGEVEGGHLPWRLPTGETAWTPLHELDAYPGPASTARERVVARGRRLLGAPYEWGGGTSGGFDCSGFMQILLGSVGIDLPRDADLQADSLPPLELGEEGALGGAPGTLLFFGEPRIDHVGMLLGDQDPRLLHASGTVRIEEFDTKRAVRGRVPIRAADPFSSQGDP